MVTLFRDLDERVRATVARIERGEHVALSRAPNSSLIVADVIERVHTPVAVRVPWSPDGYVYAALTAAAQCGGATLSSVASALRSPADTNEAAARLNAALQQRILIVENADVMGSDEWRELVRPDAEPIVRFFLDRANLRTVQEGEWIPQPSEPLDDARWDSKRMWQLCQRDVDTFGLAAARVLLTGANDHKRWSPEEIAYDVWRAAPHPMRSLMLMLWIHGRPLDRRFLPLFEAFELEPTVDEALRCLIVQERAGQLSLHPRLWPQPPLSPLEQSDWHRRLALAFENAVAHTDLGALAILEAHRHYGNVPDVAGAARLTEFGVPSLLIAAQQQSREGRVSPERFRDSARTYQVILDLDRKLSTPNDRRGIGPRVRAYATHYAAFNRYRAGEDSIERTLDAYESALASWPENALFWSRLVVGKFVALRPLEALGALRRAYTQVPAHHERDAMLIERTIERLVGRHLDLAAKAVLGNRQPRTAFQSVLRQLDTRLSKGVSTRVLWTRNRELHFLRDVTVTFTTSPEVVVALPDFQIVVHGGDSSTAVERVTDALLDAVQRAVLDSNDIKDALAYSRVLDQSELARKSEHERWLRYLLDLACREESGLVTSAQRATVLRLWERAQHMFPSLRRPAVGSDDQGRLHLAWAFQDLPDQELTIEIERDGKLDWFFRDPQKNIKLGSEHPVETLSDAELKNLGVFLQ